ARALPTLMAGAVRPASAPLLIVAAASPLVAVAAPGRLIEVTPTITVSPLLFLSLLAHAFVVGLEVFNRHAVHDATLAARIIQRGPYRWHFWGGVVLGGVFVPLLLLIAGAAAESMGLTALGAILALAGAWCWEDLGGKAGQSVPLS